MLSTEQISEFTGRGCVCLKAAFSPADARRMEDFVWERLAELHGIDRHDPGTWAVDAPWGGLNKYKNDPVFDTIASPALVQAIDQLLGAGAWKRPRNWGGFLVKFPDPRQPSWNMGAGSAWHVDFHFTYPPDPLFGVRVFTFLSAVEPRGGATLIVPGSHRLVERYVSRLEPAGLATPFPQLRDRFNASDPWLRRLTGPDPQPDGRIACFMDREQTVDGVPVTVEEMCGDPGDIVLMHPWLLHAPSQNTGRSPRFQLAKDIFRSSERSLLSPA